MPALFKDHFSGHAREYASHRPGYPRVLFDWLATLTPGHALAWDCATGNGQAAIGLAAHYRSVVASDASAGQIRNRQSHERIHYLVALAEAVPLRDGSCDPVTVAQSAHWFDFPRFHAETHRVLKRDGAIVLWAYERFGIGTEVDAIVDDFYRGVVGPFWPPERQYVEDGYRTVPFPYAELATPPFELSVRWTLEQLLRYIDTWSAVRRYREARGADPLPDFARALAGAWGEPGEARHVRWRLHLRAGRV